MQIQDISSFLDEIKKLKIQADSQSQSNQRFAVASQKLDELLEATQALEETDDVQPDTNAASASTEGTSLKATAQENQEGYTKPTPLTKWWREDGSQAKTPLFSGTSNAPLRVADNKTSPKTVQAASPSLSESTELKSVKQKKAGFFTKLTGKKAAAATAAVATAAAATSLATDSAATNSALASDEAPAPVTSDATLASETEVLPVTIAPEEVATAEAPQNINIADQAAKHVQESKGRFDERAYEADHQKTQTAPEDKAGKELLQSVSTGQNDETSSLTAKAAISTVLGLGAAKILTTPSDVSATEMPVEAPIADLDAAPTEVAPDHLEVATAEAGSADISTDETSTEDSNLIDEASDDSAHSFLTSTTATTEENTVPAMTADDPAAVAIPTEEISPENVPESPIEAPVAAQPPEHDTGANLTAIAAGAAALTAGGALFATKETPEQTETIAQPDPALMETQTAEPTTQVSVEEAGQLAEPVAEHVETVEQAVPEVMAEQPAILDQPTAYSNPAEDIITITDDQPAAPETITPDVQEALTATPSLEAQATEPEMVYSQDAPEDKIASSSIEIATLAKAAEQTPTEGTIISAEGDIDAQQENNESNIDISALGVVETTDKSPITEEISVAEAPSASAPEALVPAEPESVVVEDEAITPLVDPALPVAGLADIPPVEAPALTEIPPLAAAPIIEQATPEITENLSVPTEVVAETVAPQPVAFDIPAPAEPDPMPTETPATPEPQAAAPISAPPAAAPIHRPVIDDSPLVPTPLVGDHVTLTTQPETAPTPDAFGVTPIVRPLPTATQDGVKAPDLSINTDKIVLSGEDIQAHPEYGAKKKGLFSRLFGKK